MSDKNYPTKSDEKQPLIYDAPQLDEDEADTFVFAAVERQRHHQQQHQRQQRNPLSSTEGAKPEPGRGANLFKKAAKQVIMRKRASKLFAQAHVKQKAHRSQASVSLNLLENLRQQQSQDFYDPLGMFLNDNAAGLDGNDDAEPDPFFSLDDTDGLPTTNTSAPADNESRQETSYGTAASLGEPPLDTVETENVAQATSPMLGNWASSPRRKRKLRILYNCTQRFVRCLTRLGWQSLLRCYFVIAAIPLTIAAAILFYSFGNPAPDFLPGNATLSWWCNFTARQIVTLAIAKLLHFWIVECLLLQSNPANLWLRKNILNPFVTLALMQSHGWPSILVFWSVLDMFALHGDNPFQTHWLYWTGLKIYSEQANSGGYIIDSAEYLRVLICVLIAGIATTLKRAFLAVAFGRRLFAAFKPKLEMLLVNIVLISEVAALGSYAETIEGSFEAGESVVDKSDVKEMTKLTGTTLSGNVVKWSTLEGHESGDEDISRDSERGSPQSPRNTKRSESFTLSRTSSGSIRIKQLLDRWDEPTVKAKAEHEVTIEDLLRFHQALDFMDEMHPFGQDFGRASTRDECIESSHSLYRKLMNLSSMKSTLSFSVFELLVDDEGDEIKLKGLRRLFAPGKDESLDMLMFVMSVDSLYRRLRYFQASVGNAGTLDRTLEGIFNILFYFVLGLMLVSVLNFNPWSMLVSVTSLLVSFSFAFGSTVSKYVQGILLIAVTRPFDLGDRIFLENSSVSPVGLDNAGNGWLVEDISLSTTKLRYAKTNEVAYLANNLISEMRIYNANRSPGATVLLELVLGITILEGDNLEKFRSSLQLYVKENPRRWDSMLFCRMEEIDADNEKVRFVVSFRHRNSWQDAPRIKLHRQDLILHVYDLAEKLKVNLDSAPSRSVVYIAGTLENGAVERYKTKLLRPSNIRSKSDFSLGAN